MAAPKVSERGRCFANGTGIFQTARHFLQLRQCACLLPASPTSHQDKNGHDADPDGFEIERQNQQSHRAEEPNRCGNHQASRAPENEPQERAQNLPAIERKNRQEIEEQQSCIDVNQRPKKSLPIRPSFTPPHPLSEHRPRQRERKQDDIDQRPGGNGPKRGARSRRRRDEGHTTHGQRMIRFACPPTCRHASA